MTTTAQYRVFLLLSITSVVIMYIQVLRAGYTRAPLQPSGGHLPWIRRDCAMSTKGGKYSGEFRDCKLYRPPTCTRQAPCTPCSIFGGPIDYCVHCGPRSKIYGNYGNCNFTEGEGPYCLYGLETRPCELCCY